MNFMLRQFSKISIVIKHIGSFNVTSPIRAHSVLAEGSGKFPEGRDLGLLRFVLAAAGMNGQCGADPPAAPDPVTPGKRAGDPAWRRAVKGSGCC